MIVSTLRALCLTVLLMLTACGEPSQQKAPSTPMPAASTLKPADAALASLYEQSCKACHANPASGAPQAGDRAAWQPRVAQGMGTLIDHTVNGYKGMPPLGSCMDCGEDEFAALIAFMSGEPGT